MKKIYDTIVVGAGHAGCEAAHIVAKRKASVLVITMNLQTIGQMSCNPAMGGIAKGQIVREIDALGGMSGRVTDVSTIQFRMLNRSKGPAVWSPRSQNDRLQFSLAWRAILEKNKNIDFWQGMVKNILTEKKKIVGIKTDTNISFYGKSVILTNGTFLNGRIHIGLQHFQGGRAGERASYGLTEQLQSLGFDAGRMKTGTPPRLDGRSIDFSKMTEQKGDEEPSKFSFSSKTSVVKKQKSCFIAYTHPEVHKILEESFMQSPLFSGKIQATGPRYCPSIEDKIYRFKDRTRHQLFIEPEGLSTIEIYLNGFSTSLPYETQLEAIRKIEGLEKAKLFRPGYAIEYDYFPPTQLKPTLETKEIENLYFAGQINGTTGYEEAACQGLVAGINAYNKIYDQDPFILSRKDAYIGVLIDDLINKGTDEPYRMFTSRAEHRILLRQDNADLRLTSLAYSLGLHTKKRYEETKDKEKKIREGIAILEHFSLQPQQVNGYLEILCQAPIKQKTKAIQLIKRPQINLIDLLKKTELSIPQLPQYPKEVIQQIEIQIKYREYIEKEQTLALKLSSLDNVKISSHLDYQNIKALSNEAREKLKNVSPLSLGQASRISGVSPADVTILLTYIHQKRSKIKK